MKGKQIIIIILFIIIYWVGNYYVGLKIFQSLNNFIYVNKLWYWNIFWAISFSYILGRFFAKYLTQGMINSLSIVGYYWMIVLFFGLAVFPVVDIMIFICNKSGIIQGVASWHMINSITSVIIAVLFISIIVFGSLNARKSYVDKISVTKEEHILNEDLNIVMVSDIHLGTMIGNKRLKRMVDEINTLNPDVVIVAGDIVDTEIEPFIDFNMAEQFSNIKSKYGTFAALGNHDLIMGQGDVIANELSKNGVVVLRDEVVLVNNSFYIIGRDDSIINKMGGNREALNNIIEDIDNSKLKIVIDHTPSSIEESKKSGIDIHFSGHTHKGQIAPGNLITKKIFEVDHGHLKKDNLNVIVSCGYGTWGPPIRIGSKSEIINVIVK